jgi:hypothetical protein
MRLLAELLLRKIAVSLAEIVCCKSHPLNRLDGNKKRMHKEVDH